MSKNKCTYPSNGERKTSEIMILSTNADSSTGTLLFLLLFLINIWGQGPIKSSWVVGKKNIKKKKEKIIQVKLK